MASPVLQAVPKSSTPSLPAAPGVTRVPNAQSPANDAHYRPGTDPQDFVRANRMHIEHGSLFIDPYLVIHPRELDPANEAQLRAKLQLTYSINNPSFYEAPERVAIALNLGHLVPVSLASKRSKLMDEVTRFNNQVDTGADTQLQQQADDRQSPFNAIVRDTVENPTVDPVGLELLKNGLSIYMLIREKLTQKGYLNKLTDYVERSNTSDQVLHDLSDKIGVTSSQIAEAAHSGGVEGVGKLLGLDPKYVADVKALSDYASTQDFGYNLVEHWYLGRQLLNAEASLQDKLTTGMDARITAKIGEYRSRVRHYYDVPEPIQAQEKKLAHDDMSVLEPIQRQVLFALGYEICHTPENTADNIAFHKGIYGLHRRAANDPNYFEGTNRIFYAGHGSLKGQVGTLAHEAAHNFWPNYFDKPQIDRIDQLARDDAAHFGVLKKIMDERFDDFETLLGSYKSKAGDAKAQAGIIAAANEQFQEYGITVDGLFPHLADAKSFRFLVSDACDVLDVNGPRYARSGYNTWQERFREVISRFAEMRQVSHRHEPEVMKFLTPGLTQVWEKHYIPHLERVYQDLTNPQKALMANGGMVTPNVGTVGMGTPAANDELPKVEERPAVPQPQGTPVRAAAENAASPTNEVQRASVAMDANKLAAFSALKSMGIGGH